MGCTECFDSRSINWSRPSSVRVREFISTMVGASLETSVRASCTTHAGDLLQVARLAEKDGKPHIAFHLALLALEELGKLHLHAIARIQDAHGDDGRAFF